MLLYFFLLWVDFVKVVKLMESRVLWRILGSFERRLIVRLRNRLVNCGDVFIGGKGSFVYTLSIVQSLFFLPRLVHLLEYIVCIGD